MKYNSKNNYSVKNRKQNKNNSDANFYSKNINSSKKNNKFPINSSKNDGFDNFTENKKNKVHISYNKGRKPVNNSNTVPSPYNKDTYKGLSTKKSFDDWIWGKHSVFEALVS